MDFNTMSRQELESALARFEAEYEDLDEMTRFHFANTSDHINAQEVKAAGDRLTRIKDQIAEIRALLTRV